MPFVRPLRETVIRLLRRVRCPPCRRLSPASAFSTTARAVAARHGPWPRSWRPAALWRLGTSTPRRRGRFERLAAADSGLAPVRSAICHLQCPPSFPPLVPLCLATPLLGYVWVAVPLSLEDRTRNRRRRRRCPPHGATPGRGRDGLAQGEDVGSPQHPPYPAVSREKAARTRRSHRTNPSCLLPLCALSSSALFSSRWMPVQESRAIS